MRVLHQYVLRECTQCGATLVLDKADLHFTHYEFDGMEFPNFDCCCCGKTAPFKDPPYLWWAYAPRRVIPKQYP
jgi:hypothetical protein